MTAHPIRTKRRELSTPRSLVAPVADDLNERRTASWVDKHNRSGCPYVGRTTHRGDVIPGTVPVLTYRDYFAEYRGRPETQSPRPRRHAVPRLDDWAAEAPCSRSGADAREDWEGESAGSQRQLRPQRAAQSGDYLRAARLPPVRAITHRSAAVLLRALPQAPVPRHFEIKSYNVSASLSLKRSPDTGQSISVRSLNILCRRMDIRLHSYLIGVEHLRRHHRDRYAEIAYAKQVRRSSPSARQLSDLRNDTFISPYLHLAPRSLIAHPKHVIRKTVDRKRWQ